MNYQIQPMTAEHIPRIAALEKVCFGGEAWSEALFWAALENPAVDVLLARGEDSGILGYAVLSGVLDEGNLDSIAVAPAARRQGAADALLTAVLVLCRERGLVRLMLEVRASNAPAIALYEKHGFTGVGRRKSYYTGPREDAILMTAKI